LTFSIAEQYPCFKTALGDTHAETKLGDEAAASTLHV